VKTAIWNSISSLAAQQCGAISVPQLRACGLSSRAQASAACAGLVEVVEPRVVVLSSAPDTWRRRLWVGNLALNGRGWISHRAAARLHDFDRFGSELVDFTVLRDQRGLRLTQIGTLHTISFVGPLDIVTLDGLRVTSATRTIIDLAALGVAETLLGAAIDSSVRRRLSAPIVIARRFADLRGTGRRGAQLLDSMLVDAWG
jgi:hypothetical protein